jgi:formamidopyrimidine-DNA glycosylase
MPELPEVESTRRSFAGAIHHARIVDVWLGKPLRWPLGVDPATLVGRRVLAVRRRGKYLLLDLDAGLLMLHLGMSGSLSFSKQPPARGVHDHLDVTTDLGTLRLNDPRRFGAAVWVPGEQDPRARKLLGSLGVEPLGDDFCDAAAFHAALHGRRSAIKQVLLAGDVVVGVGNIYASEALFMAGIRPTLSAARLSRPRAARLQLAIREVLGRAVQAGGTTLRNYSNAVGERGTYQFGAQVYGREGQPCVACHTPIRLIRQGQRATYYCPLCQKN